MIKPGLVSITFRELPARQIVDLVVRGGLEAIEWGGDIHVPHGQTGIAKATGTMTRDAGLEVAAYGSYYRAGGSEAEGLSFRAVLDSAEAMEAPTIRVWAGNLGSDKADAACRGRVVEDTRRIAEMAKQAGIGVSFEHHGGTLTDTQESALDLYERVACDNVQLYWQPPVNLDFDARREVLRRFLPHLGDLHVFHWDNHADKGVIRRPLAEGLEHWREYLDIVRTSGRDHFALLEFVADNSPDRFLADAQTLREMLAKG